MDDSYCYEGTNVLKNKLGLHTPEQLDKAERQISLLRYRRLVAEINSGKFKVEMTASSYAELHRRTFQDIYEWAGKVRTVDIAKKHLFCRHQFIAAELAKRFSEIQKENGLKGLSREAFSQRAALHLAEINAIHPFREGNGRTQRLFLKALAHQAGHRLDLSRITEEPWMRASLDSFDKGTESLTATILSAMPGIDDPAEKRSRENRREAIRDRLERARSTPDGQDRPLRIRE